MIEYILSVILFISITVTLVIATFTIYFWKKNHGCIFDKNVMCYKDWSCETKCPKNSSYNLCYLKLNNLPECLYGPDSVAAKFCYIPKSDGTLCPCKDTKKINCMSGCAINLSKSNTNCCCVPGSNGCPNKTLPPGCV